jgi:hypothetical protein
VRIDPAKIYSNYILTPAVIVRKVISPAMNNRESVGSFSESHRAKAKRPARRFFYPRPASFRSQLYLQDGFPNLRSIIPNSPPSVPNFPTPIPIFRLALPNAKICPRRIQTGHLPAGSSCRTRSADADVIDTDEINLDKS